MLRLFSYRQFVIILAMITVVFVQIFTTPASGVAQEGASAVTIKLGNSYYVIVKKSQYSGNVLKVPNEYPTIHLAIQAVQDGDTILVDDGTYYEDLWILGEDTKTFTIVSKNGPENTIISGSGTNSVITFSDKSKSELNGFTIQNGYNASYGGGILCGTSSKPRILNCNIINNKSGKSGGGIHIPSYSSPTIENCKIIGNSTIGGTEDSSGGGIQMSLLAKPIIKNCTFSNNSSSYYAGAIAAAEAQPQIINCVFTNNFAKNRGGAIALNYSPAKIINCAFINNSAEQYAGAIALNSSAPQIINCTFRDNHTTGTTDTIGFASRGGAISASNNETGTMVVNSIFWNNYEPSGLNDLRVQFNYKFEGVSYSLFLVAYECLYTCHDNYSGDPLFLADSQYLISGNSPAIDHGTATGAPAYDIQNQSRPKRNGFDIGVDEVP